MYSPAFSALPEKREAHSNRAVWLMTPSRLRASAISEVPLRGGMTTTLSAASGPGSRICRSNSVTPIIAAMARMTAAVSRPLIVLSNPPRSRTGRSGGGGAAVGLIASLGLRGDARFSCAGSSEGTGNGAGSGFLRLRKNMDILFGPRLSPTPSRPDDAVVVLSCPTGGHACHESQAMRCQCMGGPPGWRPQVPCVKPDYTRAAGLYETE